MPEAGSPQTEMRSALIVDDSRLIRRISRDIVSSLGLSVTECENGHEALRRCNNSMPDIILLDWDMPVMTGIDFVTALRRMHGGGHPKVVFCTSKSGAHDIHKGISAGADEWVVKPFDDASLKEKLRNVGVT